MTPEQLLQPRYIVIADYPYATYKVGDIIPTYESAMAYICKDQDEWSGKACMADFPALFKKLNWWEHRHFSEYPKYIKKKGDDIVFEVTGWRSSPNTAEITGFYISENAVLLVECVLPVSEEDYKKFINENT